MADLIFREATINDLNSLDIIRDDNLKNLHLKRLKNQRLNFVKYIIALEGENPVGSVLITYKSSYSWHKYPAIEDLYVKESVRKKVLQNK